MIKKAEILIVEDENIVAIDLKKILERLDYSVVGIARNGDEAIKKAVELKPNLILMDIMLGSGINGVEAAGEIKKTLNVPVVFLTAYADTKTIQKAKQTGPFGYITKPFEDRVLYAVVEMALFKFKFELDLYESEERFRTLVEHSPFAIAIHDQTKILYANPASLELLGAKNPDQIIGTPVYDIIHPAYQKMELERISGLKKSEKPVSIEEKIIMLNGEIIDVEIYSSLIDYRGKTAIQVVIKDLTEIKRKEKILQATLKILNSAQITDSLDELYGLLHKIILEFIPVKNFLIAVYDQSTFEIKYPFIHEEISSKNINRDFDNLIVEKLIKINKSQFLAAQEIDEIYKANSISGIIPKCLFGVPLHINQSLTGIIIVKEYKNEKIIDENVRDLVEIITYPVSTAIQRRIVEEERKGNNKYLQELNETKDKFFSIISHDLKSPFNSLLGFGEILKTEYDFLTEDERKEYINNLYLSINNLYSFVKNLLEFSRFRTGGFEFNPEQIKLPQIINENVGVLSGIAAKKKILIEIKIEDEIIVYADEGMLNSILQNLISNSIKFTQKNGKIIITAKQENNFAIISVADTGVGMSEELKSNLFKIEMKQSTPGTENERGTGLGLLIIKDFVEQNGGVISVDSKPGSGSIFIFTLPAVKKE